MVRVFVTFALKNRLVVLPGAEGLFAWGIYSIKQNPIDAIPDFSENQVIVLQSGWAELGQLMEDQRV